MGIEVSVEGGVGRIFLNRPEKVNALDSPHLGELKARLEDLPGDDSLRVVVLAGRGRAFCGGADVGELRGLNASTAGRFVERIHEVCAAIRGLPVPVVARLHGAVVGAGLEIAAACDLRVAAEGTRFAMPEVRIGIPSVVEAALLPRLIGRGRAAWLVLTGEAIDAERALQWGLIEEIGDGEPVVKALLAAEREALRLQKQLLQLWSEAPLATSVTASVAAFGRAFAHGNTIPSRLERKKH
jgi:enoyl-CoA hydratase/carnithine racemase